MSGDSTCYKTQQVPFINTVGAGMAASAVGSGSLVSSWPQKEKGTNKKCEGRYLVEEVEEAMFKDLEPSKRSIQRSTRHTVWHCKSGA